MTDENAAARELPPDYRTIKRNDGVLACPICDWPMATRMEDGCVPGNCSYRPLPGTSQWERVQRNRAMQGRIQAAVLAERAEGNRRVAAERTYIATMLDVSAANWDHVAKMHSNPLLRERLIAKSEAAKALAEAVRARSGQ